MKRSTTNWGLLILLWSGAHAQEQLRLMPLFQQTTLYFTSDHVTVSGIGGGIGLAAEWSDIVIGQTDVNLLWAHGNAIATRLSVGIQRPGAWSPAVSGTCGLLWGQRTEVLSETGERPPSPVWMVGLRIAPIRFRGRAGYGSVLEIGYGVGPDRGIAFEVTLLSVGALW